MALVPRASESGRYLSVADSARATRTTRGAIAGGGGWCYPLLALGNSFPRIGKRQAAAEQFAIATTIYRELDMRYWLEQAEAGRDT